MMPLLLCFALLGVGEGDEVAKRVEKFLKLSYPTGGSKIGESIMITDPEEVRAITATIGVEDTHEGLHEGLVPMCPVVFILPDGKMMEVVLGGRKSLDQSFWGQIYLKDEKFYKKLCEIASKHAGREIDIIKQSRRP
jgi:hypothetical protein